MANRNKWMFIALGGVVLVAGLVALALLAPSEGTTGGGGAGPGSFNTISYENDARSVRQAAVAPDGKTMAVGTDGGGTELRRLPGGELLQTLVTTETWTLAYSPDSTMLATLGGKPEGKRSTRIWGVPDGSLLTILSLLGERAEFLFAPDSASIILGHESDVRNWKVPEGLPLRALTAQGLAAGEGRRMAFTPDGGVLAVAMTDTVHMIKSSDGTVLATMPGEAHQIAFSPNGLVLATTGQSNGQESVQLWLASEGRKLRSVPGWYYAAFSPDGKTIASPAGPATGTVNLWNVDDATLLRALEGHTGPIKGVAFFQDGRTIATASADGTARLWQASDGKLIATQQVGDAQGMSFSQGEGYMVVWEPKKVHIWKIDSGR